MGIALNFLWGIGTFFYGFYFVGKFLIREVIPSLVALPSKTRCWKERDPHDLVPGPMFVSLVILLLLPSIFGAVYSEHRHLWALYGLYAMAGLGVTNVLSGIYELGRWQRSKKNAEKQEAKAKIQEQAKKQEKPVPVCTDDESSLLTEINGLSLGISEKTAKAMIVKINCAYSAGAISDTALASFSRMVYNRQTSPVS